jgi:hypothetical protein
MIMSAWISRCKMDRLTRKALDDSLITALIQGWKPSRDGSHPGMGIIQ